MSDAVFQVHRCGDELCVRIVDEKGNEVDVKLQDLLSLIWLLMKEKLVRCDLSITDWNGNDYCCILLSEAKRDG